MSACPPYVPPSASAIGLVLVGGYAPPAGSVVVFLLDPCEGSTPASAGPRQVLVGMSYGSGQPSIARPLHAPWNRLLKRQSSTALQWDHSSALQKAAVVDSGRVRGLDHAEVDAWVTATPFTTAMSAGWLFVGAVDRFTRSVFGGGAPGQASTTVAWAPVYAHDLAHLDGWQAAKPAAIIYDPPPVTSGYVPPLGSAANFALHPGYVTPAGGLVSLLLVTDNGDRDPYVVLRQDPSPFAVQWGLVATADRPLDVRWGRGQQYHQPDPPPTDSPWTGSPNEPPPIPIARRVYIVMNDVSVVRLPDGTPIDVLSVDLSASVDAWCWSLRMELANPDQLALLKPDGNGPKLVQITMNSYVWTAVIEGRDSSRVHANAACTVTGRSQTALLSDTYAARRSLAVTDAYSAQQLAGMEITDRALPFSIDWQGIDWVVPGGVWYYQELSPIEVISQIAASRGAVLQSHPSDPTLIVQSRYPTSPWAWSAGVADVSLPSSWMTGITAQQQSKPVYDAVIIAGQQQGVLAKVTRAASAGETFAAQVVDQLNVTAAVAQERGRNVLSDRGIQEQVDVDIPLFAPGSITAGVSGLYSPLLLVDVQDPTDPWQGQTIGVSISARRAGNDGKALEIWQRVSLERHLTDAN